MAMQVCNGAILQCTMGLGPGTLTVLPVNMVNTTMQPAANIMDHVPMVNIMPFPMCQAKANPTVIAATAAAMGTPTPAACIPNTPGPWSPGASKVLIKNQPALNDSSTLSCVYGGTISVQMAGQMTHKIP